MNRRVAALLLALSTVVGGTLSGCSTFNRNDAVAVVNGEELSRDTFDSWMRTELLQNPAIAPGTTMSSLGREFVMYWTLGHLLAPLTSGLDTTALDQDLTTRYGNVWTNAPASLRTTFLTFQALNSAAQNETLDRTKITELLGGTVWIDPRLGVWDARNGTVVGRTA